MNSRITPHASGPPRWQSLLLRCERTKLNVTSSPQHCRSYSQRRALNSRSCEFNWQGCESISPSCGVFAQSSESISQSCEAFAQTVEDISQIRAVIAQKCEVFSQVSEIISQISEVFSQNCADISQNCADISENCEMSAQAWPKHCESVNSVENDGFCRGAGAKGRYTCWNCRNLYTL